MHPVRKQRLIIVLLIVVGSSLGVALVFFALKENLNLFYPPSKVLMGEAPENRTIRAGGCVVPGSIKRDDTSLRVHFDVTDGEATLPVIHEGILPDMFSEGEAAVMVGKYRNGVFEADEVLAKHDENYMPKEVADSIENKTSEYASHPNTCKVIDYGS
ncbi:MAG: cytochrome c maturation protein CcmE [Agarilytica sp.]